jgi:S-adenosylmethionine decarboxylase
MGIDGTGKPEPTRQGAGRELCSHHFSAILPAGEHLFAWTAADFVRALQQVAQQCGLTVVSETAVSFANRGMSAVVLLAESHIALHFWPELGQVTVDIHVCDFQNCNLTKARQVSEQLTMALCDDSRLAEWHYFKVTQQQE